jgi:hypothetical protein
VYKRKDKSTVHWLMAYFKALPMAKNEATATKVLLIMAPSEHLK